MHVIVVRATHNYFACTASAFCAHRNKGAKPITYVFGPVTYPLAPWQPSCADTRLKFPGDPILNLCCNNAVRGIDPKKPTQFVTVTINDFNNKVQCRVAPNSP
ncbi:hypothetical protein Pst134EA_019084 [Puccinia striiformis f. sp. tritici]|uniref:hypothetical protein n=1 Tax=Puccinia striiformis f. sp. tritici TaxID=168172 RepID=UPI0020072007|nr:hypothetical protein Pst134EA_019084 [Puccinia striiformis f. sp. tritici]KAH9458930.1 hypothetical protein Pst134EA_019084 [Puccinia striiformis f. sp. tritici]KAI9599873.1 hypothetical protein KEM48_010933 [Puccinia striiformis f. sp. tritici PST-130]KAI9615483.1 hypothetical protein H4Q26_011422 [Puccinia striiformis f. sp. tritici PST-130]